MARKTKDHPARHRPKPNNSEDTALAEAVVQKYTELADHLLNSDTINGPEGCDPEDKEN